MHRSQNPAGPVVGLFSCINLTLSFKCSASLLFFRVKSEEGKVGSGVRVRFCGDGLGVGGGGAGRPGTVT